MRFDCRDPIPIGGTGEHVLCGSAVDRQRGSPSSFYDLRNVDRIDVVTRATQPNLCSHWRWGAGSDDAFDDLAHPVRKAEQVRATVRFLRDLFYRTSEINIDNADAELLDQPVTNAGHRFGIVIPNLYRQRTGFVAYTPKSVRMLGSFVQPDKSLGIHHLGRVEPDAAIFPDNLPVSVVRVTRHRSLENGRIDRQRTDLQRLQFTSQLDFRGILTHPTMMRLESKSVQWRS